MGEDQSTSTANPRSSSFDTENKTASSPSSPQTENQAEEHRSGTGLINVIVSVFASIFGVQSDKNRNRDFEKGKASDYIMVGILVVLGIMIGMIVLVNTIIASAQG